MTKETTTRQVQEMYPDSDAATKSDLEGLAHAISHFRSMVWHISAQENSLSAAIQIEQAAQRKRSAQRRLMLEWAVAAIAGVAALVPAAGYYRHHVEQARIQEQQQAMKQREADTQLLDQVSDEISEAVPDAMRPLAEMDVTYADGQNSGQQGKTNARN